MTTIQNAILESPKRGWMRRTSSEDIFRAAAGDRVVLLLIPSGVFSEQFQCGSVCLNLDDFHQLREDVQRCRLS